MLHILWRQGNATTQAAHVVGCGERQCVEAEGEHACAKESRARRMYVSPAVAARTCVEPAHCLPGRAHRRAPKTHRHALCTNTHIQHDTAFERTAARRLRRGRGGRV
jgi:hypothetical protein